MQVYFGDQADPVYVEFLASRDSDDRYDRLWDVLERILDDLEAAQENYVSTFQLWGSDVPGTPYTLFWHVDEVGLTVDLILRVVTP